jgi:hypothetical protein
MARKRKSSSRSPWIVGLAVLVVLAWAGFAFFNTGENDPFRTVAPLDVASYLENSNTLRGNVYKVEGRVAESLAWSPESGRLISLEVGEDLIPVLVTPAFNAMNIQKEQRLFFVLEVDDKGILRTRKVSKA